jgi:pyridoxal phosphate enzyme (YggS family)
MDSGLNDVRGRIALAAARVGRDPAEVALVVVSKGVPDAAVQAAYDAGVRDFGENRADTLVGRVPGLPGDVRWHFIGRLQGNKVRAALGLLHSLDRTELARYWAAAAGPPPVLVEVNVSGEGTKAGVAPGDVEALVATATGLGLEVRGLMTMAPLAADPEAARPHFAALRRLRDRIGPRFPALTELSMGMTDDFEVAVEEGATILRVGRAIFRSSPKED